MRVAMLRATVVALIVVIAAAVGAAPAQSRCLAADVVVHRTHQPDHPVLTDGQCLLWTPFGAYVRAEKDVNAPTVTGAPSGLYVEVWVPFD